MPAPAPAGGVRDKCLPLARLPPAHRVAVPTGYNATPALLAGGVVLWRPFAFHLPIALGGVIFFVWTRRIGRAGRATAASGSAS